MNRAARVEVDPEAAARGRLRAALALMGRLQGEAKALQGEHGDKVRRHSELKAELVLIDGDCLALEDKFAKITLRGEFASRDDEDRFASLTNRQARVAGALGQSQRDIDAAAGRLADKRAALEGAVASRAQACGDVHAALAAEEDRDFEAAVAHLVEQMERLQGRAKFLAYMPPGAIDSAFDLYVTCKHSTERSIGAAVKLIQEAAAANGAAQRHRLERWSERHAKLARDLASNPDATLED
jgi:hypothetical protein